MNLFKKVEDYASDFTTYPRTFEGYRWYKPLIIGALAIILYLVLCLGIITAVSMYNPDIFYSSTNPSDFDSMAILTSIIIVLMVPSIYIPSRLLRERPFSSYLSSLGGWKWSVFIKSAAISILVFTLITILQILIDGAHGESSFTILTFILCIIITPFQCFAEEYLCRGFLMQTFGSWFKIPVIAIILQALIFTLLHQYNAIGLAEIFVSGFIFGFVTWYSKGLEVSSAIHTINNIFAFSLTGFGYAVATTEVSLIDFSVNVMTLAIILILILFADKKYDWFGFGDAK